MQRSSSPTHQPAPPRPSGQAPLIREATPGDAGDIARIRVRGWQTAYRGQLDDTLLDAMSPEADTERWRTHVASPPAGWHGFVARRDGQTVGFATCGPSRDAEATPDTGEIYAIYVRPEDVGTGAGRALLEASVRALSADHHRELTLWVLATNVQAQRFYRMAGFVPDGAAKRDELDHFTLDEIRFRRRLP